MVRVLRRLRLVLLAANFNIYEGAARALLALVPRELGGLQDFHVHGREERVLRLFSAEIPVYEPRAQLAFFHAMEPQPHVERLVR